eukprot:217551-Amphidinium_carterae.2
MQHIVHGAKMYQELLQATAWIHVSVMSASVEMSFAALVVPAYQTWGRDWQSQARSPPLDLSKHDHVQSLRQQPDTALASKIMSGHAAKYTAATVAHLHGEVARAKLPDAQASLHSREKTWPPCRAGQVEHIHSKG